MGLSKMINRTDTDANWISLNPILDDGEIGYASDTHIMKIGNGSDIWSALEGVRIASNEVLLGSIVGIPKSICYPESLQFVADYNVEGVFDATWGRGSLVATPVNAPVSFDGLLALENGAPPNLGKYVDYANALPASANFQTGCVRLKFIPMITPGSVFFDSKLFAIMSSGSSLVDLIEVNFINNAGDYEIFIVFYDKNGSQICNQSLGKWTDYVSNSVHEFELDWDLDGGDTKFFIDGVLSGQLYMFGERGGPGNLLRIGNGYNPASFSSLHKLDKVKVFDEVIHTDTYTVDEDDILALPDIFNMDTGNDYVLCIGGTIDNSNSPYHGFQIPDLSLLNDNLVWAWKVIA